MSTENTIIDTAAEDNLDSFAAEFFGGNTEPSDSAKSEEEQAYTEEAGDAPNEEDTHSAEDGAPEDDKSEDPEPDSDEKPKGKNRYQERINELTAKARQAERERDEALRKLEEKNNPPKANPEPQASTVDDKAPQPTDKNEDGTDKYPLGEFDPKYNADLVKYTVQKTLNEERAERERQQQEQEKLSAEEKYRNTLQETWNEKLETVQERYPDFQEKGEQMLEVFEGIDPAYGQYLTDTLMEMDAGPEVFYYLANNIEEAQNIVNAGPRKATIALAKLEAQLAGTKTTEAPKIKVTNAPTPPPQLKGSAVAKATVPLDTDDLDAFSKVMFAKKK